MDCLIPASATAFIDSIWKQHSVALASVQNAHTLEIFAVAATFVGFGIAYLAYGRRGGEDVVQKNVPALYKALEKHGWFDDLYNWYIAKVQQRIAIFLATFADLFLVELIAVRGTGIVFAVIGQGFKRLHDASANSEIKWLVAGFILLFVVIFA